MACRYCASEVDPHWHFCAACGSPTSFIQVGDTYTFTGEGPHTITLARQGGAAVDFTASVLAGEEYVQVSPKAGTAAPAAVLTLDWNANERARAMIRLVIEDGKREDIWSVHPRRLVDITVARSEGINKLALEPATLIFHPRRATRTLVLRNDGNLPERIDRIEVPLGIDFSPQGAFNLAPGEARQFTVTPDPNLTYPPIRFHRASGGTIEAGVHCRPPQNITIPSCYMGVDFGTTNTSVTYREYENSTVVPLNLFGDGSRVPTEVYCPAPEPTTNWVYGEQAIDRWVENHRQGAFVSELKTRVREAADVPIPSMPSLTPRRILVEYLRAILHGSIVPFLARNNEQALKDRNISFTFSVPVLDQGPLLEEYAATVVSCAKAAGYAGYGQIEWRFEPVCAAAYIVRTSQETLPPGTRIMIFDSGGGTTDICKGTVAMENGTHTLTEIKTGAATLDNKTQFGGTRMTWALGKTYAGKDEASKINLRASIKQEAAIADHSPDDPEEDPTFLEGPEVDAQSPDRTKWPWSYKYPRMYERIDHGKRLLVETGGPSQTFYILQQQSKDFSLNILRSDLDQLTDFAFNDLKPDIVDAMENEAGMGVYLVGGNSRLPRVAFHLLGQGLIPREWCKNDPKLTDMAVAYGASFIQEMLSNVLPYGLVVHFNDKVQKFEAGTSLSTGYSKLLDQIAASLGTSVSMSIAAELDGKLLPLLDSRQQLSITERGSVRVRATANLNEDQLNVAARTDSGSPVFREISYEI